jgi:hypothetical protein
MKKFLLLAPLLAGLTACEPAAEMDEEGTIMTTYFNGDGVLATSYRDEDGVIHGVLEDSNGVQLATVTVDPNESRWDWALDGETESMTFVSDEIEPTLAAANVADYVLWLRVRNARPGTTGDSTFSDKDPCVELASAMGQCVGLTSCAAWCESLP